LRQGDIYITDLDPALGKEQQGIRPVLIVSGTRFNSVTKLPIVVPITNGGAFSRRINFAVLLTGHGLKTTGVARCDQPRTVDLSERRARFVERVPFEVLEEVLDRIEVIFAPDAIIRLH
jgi:mRNA interferase ChpB